MREGEGRGVNRKWIEMYGVRGGGRKWRTSSKRNKGLEEVKRCIKSERLWSRERD